MPFPIRFPCFAPADAGHWNCGARDSENHIYRCGTVERKIVSRFVHVVARTFMFMAEQTVFARGGKDRAGKPRQVLLELRFLSLSLALTLCMVDRFFGCSRLDNKR